MVYGDKLSFHEDKVETARVLTCSLAKMRLKELEIGLGGRKVGCNLLLDREIRKLDLPSV